MQEDCKKSCFPCLEDYFLGSWSFPHSSLWGCWLSAAGSLDYILVWWSALSGQAAHTQASFSSGCVHKRFSVYKHRPKFCPKVEGRRPSSRELPCCLNQSQIGQVNDAWSTPKIWAPKWQFGIYIWASVNALCASNLGQFWRQRAAASGPSSCGSDKVLTNSYPELLSRSCIQKSLSLNLLDEDIGIWNGQ